MLWKLNAAFPSVIWQVYDWYLNPNAGYYFMKRACEPVHIQLNLDDSAVAVVNRSYESQKNLSIQVKVYDLNSKLLFSQNKTMSLSATYVKEAVSLTTVLEKEKGISFVVLSLKSADGKSISNNAYWFSPQHDFKALKEMNATNVKVKILKTEKGKEKTKWTFEFTNATNKLAFFINPQIVENGREILPSFWLENYFSLSPGESLTVSVNIPNEKITSNAIQLAISGWNVGKEIISLK